MEQDVGTARVAMTADNPLSPCVEQARRHFEIRCRVVLARKALVTEDKQTDFWEELMWLKTIIPQSALSGETSTKSWQGATLIDPSAAGDAGGVSQTMLFYTRCTDV